MLPGQCLIQRAFPVGVESGVDAAFLEGAQPVLVVEVFVPGIEFAAQLPGFVDDFAQSAVTPRQDCFKLADLGVLPGKMGSAAAQALFEQFLFGD